MRRVADRASASRAARSSPRALQERQVLVEDVLDAEEDVAEARLAASAAPACAPCCGDRRGHRLDDVVDVVEAGVDDRAAQRLEPRDVSVMLSSTRKIARAPRARASAMSASTRSNRYGVEVPAAHLDDRAEAAVVGAAARRLDDVDRPAEQRVAGQHARGAVGQASAASPSSELTGAGRGCARTDRRRRGTDRPAIAASGVAALRARAAARGT